MGATKNDLSILGSKLEKASIGLAKVERKKMFGCDGFFRDDAIYALVWKTGRIAVKLPDAELREKALGLEGAKPWKAGTRVMKEWVLLPDEVVDAGAKLKKWVVAAHKAAR